ncbi:MAG: hemerythrin domain-containing protein [Marinoscillum sp.]|uniref:hemerythrin domain-containing protein n=2 Tax=Marinoscillum sp. TaxID=2024838 RepID=UPI0032FEA26A
MPLKRHKALQPLSHNHHHSLLLCWKIRMGFRKQIDLNRIKRYTDWYFHHHIQPHFSLEEQHLFPILGEDHPLVKRAMAQHRRLKRLFTDEYEFKRNLSRIEDELESHIRFEERVLFQEIQAQISKSQTELPEILHRELPYEENMSDPFWE